MKVCTKCKLELDESQFFKGKNYKDGLNPWCKICYREYNKKFRQDNKEKEKKRSQEYYKNNKAKIKKYKKEYIIKNKENIKIQQEKYRQSHKEEIKKYYEDNKEERNQYFKDYYNKNIENFKNYREVHKEERNKYYRDKYKNDINYKISKSLRRNINEAMNRNWKSGHSIELLGCTIDEFKKYIESKFTEGMNWNNWGFGNNCWHIDHIIPCSSFKHLDTLEEQKTCFHYTNMQPLWQIDNLNKHAKLNWSKNK